MKSNGACFSSRPRQPAFRRAMGTFDNTAASEEQSMGNSSKFIASEERLRSLSWTAWAVASIVLGVAFAGADRASAASVPISVPVNVPRVNVPTVNVPKVNINVPTASVPKVNVPTVNVPKVNVPTVNVPKVNVRTVNVPKVNINVPTVNVPKVNVRTVNDPKVNVRTVNVPKVNVRTVNDPKVNVRTVNDPKVNVRTVNDPKVNVPRANISKVNLNLPGKGLGGRGNPAGIGGANATAVGSAANATGAAATAYGDSAIAFGANATATGANATANGGAATATGTFSAANGDFATATGQASFANGNNATATGYNSRAEGFQATATGTFSAANGDFASFQQGQGGAPSNSGGASWPRFEQSSGPVEIIVRTRPDVSQEAIERIIRPRGLAVLESQRITLLDSNLYRIRAESGQSASAAVRALVSNGTILSSQPNNQYRLAEAARRIVEGPQVNSNVADKLRLIDVHRQVTGADIPIGLIDSEVDLTHPDLSGAVVEKSGSIGTEQISHPHGTGIAGAIVAQRSLLGIAPQAKLFSFVAFGGSGELDSDVGTTFRIIKGLDWAVARKVRVINMSFAGQRDPLLQIGLKAVHEKGIVLVAAAGNAGPTSPPLYPGADPKVTAVTATDFGDALFRGANRGRHISLAAPGVDILALAPGGTYQFTSGTSVAAAHVTGVVALMLQANPKLKPEEVRRILKSTARRLGANEQFGAGLVDPFEAVKAAQQGASAAIFY
jgi:Subtilase family